MTDGGEVDRVDLSRILVATDLSPRVEKTITRAFRWPISTEQHGLSFMC
jgi:hypothetical protein